MVRLVRIHSVSMILALGFKGNAKSLSFLSTVSIASAAFNCIWQSNIFMLGLTALLGHGC